MVNLVCTQPNLFSQTWSNFLISFFVAYTNWEIWERNMPLDTNCWGCKYTCFLICLHINVFQHSIFSKFWHWHITLEHIQCSNWTKISNQFHRVIKSSEHVQGKLKKAASKIFYIADPLGFLSGICSFTISLKALSKYIKDYLKIKI